MLKWLFVVCGLVALVVVVVLAALPWLLNTVGFKGYVVQAASHALGRPVKFASLSIAPFPLPTVKLRGLEVAEDPAFGPEPFLTVGEGRMGIRLKPLFLGRVELANLVLDEPTIRLVEDERGRSNWASLGVVASASAGAPRSGARIGTASPASVLLSRISVVNGRMEYRKWGMKSAELGLQQINVTVSQAAPRGVLRLQGEATVSPGKIKLSIAEASLMPSGRAISEMTMHATVEVEARDIGALTAAFLHTSAVTGVMRGRLDMSGTLSHLAATGVMGSDGLLISDEQPRCDPRRRQLPVSDLRIPVAYSRVLFESVPVTARVANGTVALRLSVALGPPSVVALQDIDVKGVDLSTILVDFLCQPYAVTGPMDLTGQATMHAADPRRTMAGAGRFRIGPGQVTGRDMARLVNEMIASVEAESTMLASERRMREALLLRFESISGTYRIQDGVVKTDDVLYQGADLRASARGTLALADGRVDVTVIVTQGGNEVRSTVSGTTDALRVVPTGVRIPDSRGGRRLLNTLYR